MKKYKGLLFDLDGVIVDTAKYHYVAWKQLAAGLGIDFTEQDNERLKGISRMASLEIILEIGDKRLNEQEKEALCAQKNDMYLTYINRLDKDEILPGVESFIMGAKSAGYKIGLGSASKNAAFILERLGIKSLFDALIDGTKVSKAKPNPEVFQMGATALNLNAEECIVFEDAVAGIQAAKNAEMQAVGVGNPEILTNADLVIPGFKDLTIHHLLSHMA